MAICAICGYYTHYQEAFSYPAFLQKKVIAFILTTMSTKGVFETLPENFFSPLASPKKEHYAALLIVFYRLFQESSHGIERPVLMARFMDYIALHESSFISDDDNTELVSADKNSAAVLIDMQDIESNAEEEAEQAEREDEEESGAAQTSIDPVRAAASKYLRVFIKCGWMKEEVLSDYSRIINMSSSAKPFFESLAKVEEGLKTEYESHIVSIYSLLCSDAAIDNGHYTVLNAHSQTMSLIDSLKVLSQNIHAYYEIVTENETSISGLLELHFNQYAKEILDGAYKRLKTSDNLSRYRPKILKRIGELITDSQWLESSAVKFSRLGTFTAEESKDKLKTFLEEIRDTLKAVDPLLEEIDRRNMLYSKASIERIKAKLEPNSTITGRLYQIIKELIARPHLKSRFKHSIYGVKTFSSDSRYKRWNKEQHEIVYERGSVFSDAELEEEHKKIKARLDKQLSPLKIEQWLNSFGMHKEVLLPSDIITDTQSFIKYLYAVLYSESDSRKFPFILEQKSADRIHFLHYDIPDIAFRRTREK